MFTKDVARAHRVTSRLESGVIWVNYYHPSHPSAPWGGFKQSGIGRELGAYAIDEYSETKSIHYHLNPRPRRFYCEG